MPLGTWIVEKTSATAGGGGATGPAGPAPPAPNVTFASAQAIYDLWGNGTQFGFSGVLNLPTGNANYSHLKRIDVVAYGPTGESVPVASLYKAQFSGTTIAFSSEMTIPLLNPTESWTLKAWAINDDNIATANPATTVVTVTEAVVISVTADDVGPVYQDFLQGLHMSLAIVPELSRVPAMVTVWVDYGRGEGWVGQGWHPFKTAGEVWRIGDREQSTEGTPRASTIWVPTRPDHANWKVAAIVGAVSGNTPPVGSVQSDFVVRTADAPGSDEVTNARFLSATADPKDKMVYTLQGNGDWTWHYHELRWQQPSVVDKPYYWSSFCTVQKGKVVGGVFTPAPPPDHEGVNEDPALEYLGREFTDSHRPKGDWQGGTEVIAKGTHEWTYPVVTKIDGTDNEYRTFRFRMYAESRRGTDVGGGRGTFTLQTACWPGGQDHYDLVPDPQPHALDLSNANPITSFDPDGPMKGGDGFGLNVKVAPPLSISDATKEISIANKAITSAQIDDDAILARHMAQNSITAIDQALAANAIVDKNVANVSVAKLIEGHVVFSGDITLSHGSGKPVIVMDNDSLDFFQGTLHQSTGPTDASTGMDTAPHVHIDPLGVGVFKGGPTAPSIVIGSLITLYTENGNTAKPYVAISSMGLKLWNDKCIVDVTAAQIEMSYVDATVNLKMKLNATGMEVLNGQYCFRVNADKIQLWSKVDDANYPFVGITALAMYLGAGPYLTEISSSRIQMTTGGPGSPVMTLTATQFEIASSASTLRMTSTQVMIEAASGSAGRIALESGGGGYMVIGPAAGTGNKTIITGPSIACGEVQATGELHTSLGQVIGQAFVRHGQPYSEIDSSGNHTATAYYVRSGGSSIPPAANGTVQTFNTGDVPPKVVTVRSGIITSIG